MAYIYCIYCPETIWYIGSTIDFKRRERQHRIKNNKNIASDIIPDEIEWKMIILEEVEIDQRYQAEGFYIDWLSPTLNKRHPGRTSKQAKEIYWRKHQEYYNEKRRQRRAKLRAS